MVHDIVTKGGRCLIPVFALGRAQELLLILDEYWGQHSELHDIPIYYASSLAKKCMSVYQTYVNAMNSRIQKQIAISNPFVFKHVSNLKVNGFSHKLFPLFFFLLFLLYLLPMALPAKGKSERYGRVSPHGESLRNV